MVLRVICQASFFFMWIPIKYVYIFIIYHQVNNNMNMYCSELFVHYDGNKYFNKWNTYHMFQIKIKYMHDNNCYKNKYR